jgi:hypothetical protein
MFGSGLIRVPRYPIVAIGAWAKCMDVNASGNLRAMYRNLLDSGWLTILN